MITNDAGTQIIKDAEGLKLEAYLCPAGVWTIGYGHTGDVKQGQKITEHMADVILEYDLKRFEEGVTKLLAGTQYNQNQFSALVSLAYNIGLKAFEGSAIRRAIRAGDFVGAAAGFERWVYAKGKVLPGLVKRRAAERRLFLEVPS